VKANQQVVIKESDEMDYYQKSHEMSFIKTNSGIRYYVYNPSAKGDSIKTDDIIKINYKVSLLNGTECYSSKNGWPKRICGWNGKILKMVYIKQFVYLKSGDKAKILIPSHLAHGLLGDSKKIPPMSPIIYDIEIISVKKQSHN
jgi:FKBP-type peptidyl-prolyl cis-trans isomerase